MDNKDIYFKINNLLSEYKFDKARELARDNKLKETEIKILAKGNFFLAGQKSIKYGLYKKAIELYSKLPKSKISREINIIYKMFSTDLEKKDNLENLLLYLTENISEKIEEEKIYQFIKSSKILAIHENIKTKQITNPN